MPKKNQNSSSGDAFPSSHPLGALPQVSIEIQGTQLGFAVSEQQRLELVMECPTCGESSRSGASDLSLDEGLACPCGDHRVRLSGTDAMRLEAALSNFWRHVERHRRPRA